MLINFPYIKRNTLIHRLDPRAKLLLLIGYGLAAAQTSNFWLIFPGLIGCIFYYSQAKLKWVETRRVWYFVIFLNAIILLTNYFLSAGNVARGVDIGQEHILYSFPLFGSTTFILSIEGIFFLITQAMRNFSIAFLAIVIPYTTDPSHMGVAFKGMGLPDKFAYAIDLAFRFVPTISRDFSVTLDAQRARAFEIDKLRGGIFAKIARLAPMVVPVVIGSVIGAEDIISAMELRCFGIGKRSWLIELRATQLDRFLIILSIGGFLFLTIWYIVGAYYSSGPLHWLHEQGIPGFLLS
jgi:energy-coupling factor transport system permease protein